MALDITLTLNVKQTTKVDLRRTEEDGLPGVLCTAPSGARGICSFSELSSPGYHT